MATNKLRERVRSIMDAERPSQGWAALLRSGELQSTFTELYALTDTIKHGNTCHKNIFWHTMQVLDNVAKETSSRALRWAALLHDIGKIATRECNGDGRCTFNGHETEGAKMVKAIFVRFGLDNALRGDVERLVQMHMMPGGIVRDGISERAVNRLRGKAGCLLPALLILSRADVTTTDEAKRASINEGLDNLAKRIAELESADERPELDADGFAAVFNESAALQGGTCNRENYGAMKRIVVKSKGAGKGKLYDYRWEWSDFKGYIAALRAAEPQRYALLRLHYMHKFARNGVDDVKQYRTTVKTIRMQYGLSKSAVAPFMSLK